MDTTNLGNMQGREFKNQWLTPKPCERQRFYRVAIYSKDAISGTFADGVYSINLDDIPEPNAYHIAVESFVMNYSGNNFTKPVPFVIEFLDIVQPDSFNTSSRTNNRILLTGMQSSSFGGYQNNIFSSSIGVPLSDTSIMRNKQLRIQIKDIDDTTSGIVTALGAGTKWIMTLLIYKYIP